MKVIAINGSARKDGNTAILINTVFEELYKEGIETEMVQLSGKIIEPCKACWACGGRKNCVQGKDLFQEIFEKMTQADGIILGSPVYTANISANMQAFLERASVVTDMNRGGGRTCCSTKSVRLSRRRAEAAHLLHLIQCTISLCCKICLWSVPLIGQWRMDKCREMSRKMKKVLIR